MLIALLAIAGVPLWVCACLLTALVVRNRKLRKRYGDVPVRRRRDGKKHWSRGHGVWIHDVFAYRGSPATWTESLEWITEATVRRPLDAAEAKKLRRLGHQPLIAVMTAQDGTRIEFAARSEQALDLMGPFAADMARRVVAPKP